jgi:tetratricopeptide (TPR) repeat protein
MALALQWLLAALSALPAPRSNRRGALRVAAASCCVALTIPGSAVLAAQNPDESDPAVLIREGAEAMQQRRFADALEKFTEAAARRPKDASLWLAAGVAAYTLGESDIAEASLDRALSLRPGLVDAAVVLTDLQYRQGRLSDAIATVERALEHAPGTPDLRAKLEDLRRIAQFTDRMFESRGAHFRVLFEGPADDAVARRSLEMLEAAYWRVGQALTAYPPQAITVVLYTLRQFRDITRAPDWAGGLYDGRIHVAVAGALDRPDELEQVLAHEFVHAVVTMLGGRGVPQWLNEGLATALEPGGADWTRRVLEADAERLSLAQLHGGFGRLSGARVYLAYAQSAAAVRRIIELRGASALVALLADLKQGSEFEAAFHQRVAMRFEEFDALMRR